MDVDDCKHSNPIQPSPCVNSQQHYADRARLNPPTETAQMSAIRKGKPPINLILLEDAENANRSSDHNIGPYALEVLDVFLQKKGSKRDDYVVHIVCNV